MGKIYVFSDHDSDNDYSTLGLACALQPTECTFKETANGDSFITMVHPLDDYGRYTYLQRGMILSAPVPVRTTPEIQNGTVVTTVWTYKVRSESQLSGKNQRTLYKKQTGSGSMHLMNSGEIVTVVQRPSGTDTRWKVKTDYGTGWMYQSGLELVTEHIIEDNSNSIEAVKSPWKITPQLFRIYDVNKTLDTVQVTARHISYDLLYNITKFKSEETVALQDALNSVLENCDQEDHGFSAYTNVANEQTGLDYADKNPIDAFLDPEEGICARYEVNLVRDNYDLYFLHDPGLNRGVIIRYGKNMLGIEFEESDDEVVTRIIPVGENKDGTPLYLEDSVGTFTKTLRNGDKGDDVRTMQSLLVKAGISVGSTGVDGIFGSRTEHAVKTLQAKHGLTQNGVFTSTEYNFVIQDAGLTGNGRYIDSPNIGNYPVPHTYVLKCDNCTVNDKEEGGKKVTVDVARERMRAQALKMFEEGCDEPQVKMKVEFQNLGDTEEYAQFRNLENCFLFDYIIVQHDRQGINVTARIVGVEWDVVHERMNSVEIGQVGKTLANSGITTWQIPSGFSGAKISGGTIGAGQLASDIINARHIQSESINVQHLVANEIAAWVVEAVTAKFQTLDASVINAEEIYSEYIETDKLYAAIADIAKANINWANINWLDAVTLKAQIADVVDLSARNGKFDFAKVQTLVGSALNIERATGDEVYIRNLASTSASFVHATIGDLVLASDNGKYYQVTITEDGEMHTHEVTVSAGEIAAGQTSDGRQIVATNLNVERLNGASIYGSFADISKIVTRLLEAGDIRASDAFIASAVIPELYTTAIKALEKDLIFAAENSIQLMVGDYARRFMSGTRNYIPNSLYLKDAVAAGTNYNTAVVGRAHVGIDSIRKVEYVQQTFTDSSFSIEDAHDAYLLTTSDGVRAERTALSGWNIRKRIVGQSVMCRLDSLKANRAVQGVLRLAYEWNGVIYPFEQEGSVVVLDSILTNQWAASSGAMAVSAVKLSVLE